MARRGKWRPPWLLLLSSAKWRGEESGDHPARDRSVAGDMGAPCDLTNFRNKVGQANGGRTKVSTAKLVNCSGPT